ncbi:MAG: CRTAC1 family protein [Planctomycetota bacterium]|nr:MAG: CRTAC1 family protein [Planctomycetota bacterium]
MQPTVIDKPGRTSRAALVVPTACLIAWLGASLGRADSPVRLDDVTDQTGIDFVHYDGSAGKYYLIEGMSAGLALIDYDLDGDPDLYCINGAAIDPPSPDPAPRNALYRNDGGFRFVDVTDAAGVGDTGFGLAVACGDYDNDGAPDIFVNNYGPNVLYHNNGDGTFSPVTDLAGVDGGFRVAGGASFFDCDLDGDLDLYVGNYIKFDQANHKTHVHKGLPSYPSPLSFQPEPDQLFRNEGNGTFRDISESSGIAAVAGRTMGLVTFDYDGDGDIDVMAANDAQENFLFENDGQGHFEEIGLLVGIAYDYKAKPQASMGVELVDLDGDQRLDLYLTSFSEEFACYYRNLGGGLFDDKSLMAGALEATFPHITWGVLAGDFDNNGAADIFIATGDLDDLRDRRGGMSSTTAYRIPNLLLYNTGGGHLRDLGRDWGTGAQREASSRGAVLGDLDQDGRLDVVVLNSRETLQVLQNRSAGAEGRFVAVDLVGTRSNRDSFGAVVRVRQGDHIQLTQTRSGHSYQCENAKTVHFGLPSPDDPVTIEVRWLSGAIRTVTTQPGTRLTLIEPPAAP